MQHHHNLCVARIAILSQPALVQNLSCMPSGCTASWPYQSGPELMPSGWNDLKQPKLHSPLRLCSMAARSPAAGFSNSLQQQHKQQQQQQGCLHRILHNQPAVNVDIDSHNNSRTVAKQHCSTT
jgi:hypothetical protein